MPSRRCALLTRAPEDNAPLAAALRDQGVLVRELPCVETVWCTPAQTPTRPAAIAFASRRAVEGFWRAGLHHALALDEAPPVLAVVGESTASRLRDRGFEPDLIASPSTGAHLAQMLHDQLDPSAHVLVPTGHGPRGELETHLRKHGRPCHTVEVYENRAPELAHVEPSEVAVIFVAAPSAADRLLKRFPWMSSCPFLPIGATTHAALKGLGVHRILDPQTSVDAQVAALADAWRAPQMSTHETCCGPTSGVREPQP